MIDILFNILNDLRDEEFQDFKWHLKHEKLKNLPPIQERQLSKAECRDVVDLMMQKYKVDGAVEVMVRILEKISRNDLKVKLQTVCKETGDQ